MNVNVDILKRKIFAIKLILKRKVSVVCSQLYTAPKWTPSVIAGTYSYIIITNFNKKTFGFNNKP